MSALTCIAMRQFSKTINCGELNTADKLEPADKIHIHFMIFTYMMIYTAHVGHAFWHGQAQVIILWKCEQSVLPPR